MACGVAYGGVVAGGHGPYPSQKTLGPSKKRSKGSLQLEAFLSEERK